MKQFLVFGGNTYYPLGGWEDFVGDADTKEEAWQMAVDDDDNSWHTIVDLSKDRDEAVVTSI